MRYRKKPVIIEAIQYDGINMGEIEKLTNYAVHSVHEFPQMFVDTAEGTMQADIGDYIIRGIKGEYYPCKPDIFHDTYEKVE